MRAGWRLGPFGPVCDISRISGVFGACLAVAACGPSESRGVASNRATLDILPARVCVTSETATEIAREFTAASRKRLDEFGHPFKFESALDHLTVRLSNATLESFDPQTRKATCKATITYSFSHNLDALVKANQDRIVSGPVLDGSEFTIQPAADDTHLIYDFGSTADYPGYVIQQLNELDSHGRLKQG
jgi:hypothetical protein